MRKIKFISILLLIFIFSAFVNDAMSVFAIALDDRKADELLVDHELIAIEGNQDQETRQLQLHIQKKTKDDTRLILELHSGTVASSENEKTDQWQEDFNHEEHQIVTLEADDSGNLSFTANLEKATAGGVEQVELMEKPVDIIFDEETTMTEQTSESTEITDSEQGLTEGSEIELETTPSTESQKNIENETSFDIIETNGIVPAQDAVKDPFAYTSATNEAGIYPILETNQYLDSNVNTNLVNYHYGMAAQPGTPVTEAIPETSSLNFDNGYHHNQVDFLGQSGDIHTRQVVRPSGEKGIYQVFLDVIGDAVRTSQEIDVAIVIDFSSSMIKEYTWEDEEGQLHRTNSWVELKRAISAFCDKFLLSRNHRIRIGMAAFGSDEKPGGHYPYGDIAYFGDINERRLFTSSKEEIVGHEIFTEREIPKTGSGTPTFMGIETGLALLNRSERPGAKKVLLTVTDGNPSFSPTANYQSIPDTAKDKPYEYALANYCHPPNFKHKGTVRYEVKGGNGGAYISGGGSGNELENSREFILSRLKGFNDQSVNAGREFQPYGVSFRENLNTNDNDSEVAVVLANDDVSRALETDHQEEFVHYLDNWFSSMKDMVSGKIRAPMSPYVEFVREGEISALTLDEQAQTLTEVKGEGNLSGLPETVRYITRTLPSVSNGQTLTLGSVHLGNESETAPHIRQGYRYSYYVRLKDDYVDGKFYPVSKVTYLENDNLKNYYFAVPSIKNATATKPFVFKKTSLSYGTNLEGAQFALYHEGTEEAAFYSTISEKDGTLRFYDLVDGDYLMREVTAPYGFEKIADFRVKVDGGAIKNVDGVYSKKDTVAGVTVKNQNGQDLTITGISNKMLPFVLTLKKRNEGGKLIAGAAFEMASNSGKPTVQFNDMGDGTYRSNQISGSHTGTYTLYELKAPDGYVQPATKKEIVKVHYRAGGKITFGEMNKDPDYNFKVVDGVVHAEYTVKNSLKSYQLALDKVDQEGRRLAEATFDLYQVTNLADPSKDKLLTSQITNGADKALFLDKLTVGTYYRLVEREVPEGYEDEQKNIVFKVNTDESITVETLGNGESAQLQLRSGATPNELTMTVVNRLKGSQQLPTYQLPAAGGSGDHRTVFTMVGVLVALLGCWLCCSSLKAKPK